MTDIKYKWKCPHCGAFMIDQIYGQQDWVDDFVYQNVSCGKCSHTYMIYGRPDWMIAEDKNEANEKTKNIL